MVKIEELSAKSQDVCISSKELLSESLNTLPIFCLWLSLCWSRLSWLCMPEIAVLRMARRLCFSCRWPLRSGSLHMQWRLPGWVFPVSWFGGKYNTLASLFLRMRGWSFLLITVPRRGFFPGERYFSWRPCPRLPFCLHWQQNGMGWSGRSSTLIGKAIFLHWG